MRQQLPIDASGFPMGLPKRLEERHPFEHQGSSQNCVSNSKVGDGFASADQLVDTVRNRYARADREESYGRVQRPDVGLSTVPKGMGGSSVLQ